MIRVAKATAFTLVELLVVIGIIALLISILLPSLNKARQAANSVVCQSHLKQMGVLFSIYASNNKGYLPPASFVIDPTTGVGALGGPYAAGNLNPQNNAHSEQAPTTFWPDTLSLLTSKQTIQNAAGKTTGAGTGLYAAYTNLAYCYMMAADFSGIFHDTDSPSLGFQPRCSMYMSNIRVIPPQNCGERAGNINPRPSMNLRGLGSFSDGGGRTMMTWCAPVSVLGGTLSSIQYDSTSWSLDAFAYGYPTPPAAHIYCFPSVTSFTGYGNQIGLANDSSVGGSSWNGSPVTKTGLKASNVDYTGGVVNAMRFRHKNNTSMNALFVDGHCESRALGDVTARDLCMNFK